VLETELSDQQFNTWLRPLQAVEREGELKLLAPNRYVVDWLKENALPRVVELTRVFAEGTAPEVLVEVGSRTHFSTTSVAAAPAAGKPKRAEPTVLGSRINPEFTFKTFVEGKSNQLAKAAAVQVAGHPGTAYNPLFIYGGVGLGKTHLMHAVANHIRAQNPAAKVAYVHSERFVGDMVRALQHNTINEFKTAYRTC
jgi:chromosomal replication initiator protein